MLSATKYFKLFTHHNKQKIGNQDRLNMLEIIFNYLRNYALKNYLIW